MPPPLSGARPQVEVRLARSHAEFAACEALSRDIWGAAERNVVPRELLLTMQLNGGLVHGGIPDLVRRWENPPLKHRTLGQPNSPCTPADQEIDDLSAADFEAFRQPTVHCMQRQNACSDVHAGSNTSDPG